MQRSRLQRYERYEFSDSPWTQDLTQRDLATLLNTKKSQLEALVRDKELWTIRRIIFEPKTRSLVYPFGKLRRVYELLKFHLNKIKLPDYVFSPRRSRSQRDNAIHHSQGNQRLKLDLKSFYPSTSDEHVFRWAFHNAGLRGDVAGLLTKLVTIDGRVFLGSPVSPILTFLVPRGMFDAIYEACQRHGVRMSIWVDDINLSGARVTGDLLGEIRELIRSRGLMSHKIVFQNGKAPFIITGIPVRNNRVCGPRYLHRRIEAHYAQIRQSNPEYEQANIINHLLSDIGSYRYIVGRASREGQKASDRMNRLRLRKSKLSTSVTITGSLYKPNEVDSLVSMAPPFEIAEINS